MGPPKLSPAQRAAINRDNMLFSVYILIILSAIVVSMAIYRASIYSLRYLRTLACLEDDRQQFFKLPNRTFGWIKQHIIYAPLFNRRHSKQMCVGPVEMGILPSRFQSVLLAGIIAMNVTFCAYGIEWSGPLKIKLLHLRNRSGALAVVNMIPLVLMVGRNNPLIGLLNVSFDTFNLMHRWFGRIVVSLAFTHSVVEIMSMINGATAGKKVHPSGISIFTESLQAARFLLWGFIAFVAMITIILTAFTAFRHAFYETFLHIHIALASLILAGLWIHLDGLNEQRYLKAVIALWVAERLMRLISLLYRNVGRTATTADVEDLPGDAIRITLRLARPLRFTPGQHVYLTIPSIGLWTSHPFSIAWFSSHPYPSTHYQDLETANVAHITSEKCASTSLPTSQDTISFPTSQNTISLLLRRRSGFTTHLAHRPISALKSRLALPAFLEGPYGHPPPLSSYGTILLFAGGIGITAYLTPLRHMVDNYAPSTTAARRVTLVWIIRSPEHVEWIRPWMTEILSMPSASVILKIQIFVTRPTTSGTESHSPSATVQTTYAKPDVDALVETEGREQVGAMGVGVCGPGGLGDDVRLAMRRRMGERNVDFFEEGYGW